MSEEPRLLYIEDNADNREVMRLLIEDMLGYQELVLFHDTKDIITRLHEYAKSFDVIFLDIDIQPNDGYTVCQLLREDNQYHDTVVIGVTASIRPEALRRMKKIGFNGVISKPLSFNTFPQLLQRILKDGELW